MVGLYGIVATAAAARSREMAIRAAIGARPPELLRLVLGQALIAAAAGIAIGLVASLAVTMGLDSLLYEVPARDPRILGCDERDPPSRERARGLPARAPRDGRKSRPNPALAIAGAPSEAFAKQGRVTLLAVEFIDC